ncbi:MAG: helix-turn-helix domain-containing protein [Actinomycetes bacterium]
MGQTTQPLAVARTFGERLRALRRDRGWSLERLAEAAGLHWTYVGSVERGERNISLLNIVRLAAALGVDPSDLLVGLKP